MPELFIRHITLQTGHARDSFAGEVSQDALLLCKNLINKCLDRDGEKVAIPNFDGFYLAAGNVGGRTLLGSVWYGIKQPVPLINFAIATKSRNAAIAWRELHNHSTILPVTDAKNVPPVPWVAVSIEPDAAYYSDAIEWLGDFERCLAWAWIKIREPDDT